MTEIRGTCPSCGAATMMRPDQILLVGDPGRTAGNYLFLCPSCDRLAVRSAGPAALRVLLAAGVRDAAEPGPSSHAVEAPLFTRDDLLDFHLLLETDHWFSQLA